MANKEEQVLWAKIAEQTERYHDMIAVMKQIAETNSELTNEERNLLSIAYKNVVGNHRSSWRAMSIAEERAKGAERKQKIIKEYREKIEKELKAVCNEVLVLLEKYLIPKVTTTESKVFYLKMKGDYYRYLAEVSTNGERKKMADESRTAYTDAFDIAKNQMPVIHPIRLGLVLNFSVFYFEILNEVDVACRLAKQTFDDALASIDSLDPDSYRDSTLIMQLLRDNISLWTTEESDVDNIDSNENQE